MKSLFTMYRHEDTPRDGTVLYRKAYRAIIWSEGKLLLIKNAKYGEYKFPGGGKESGETAFDVLKREVLEETGYTIKRRIIPFGMGLEYGRELFEGYDIFKHESRYYRCEIHPDPGKTSLSDYEIEYGYVPAFVTPEEAYRNNLAILQQDAIPWLKRDTLVLKMLMEEA